MCESDGESVRERKGDRHTDRHTDGQTVRSELDKI